MHWVWPNPNNSDHQDYYMFSRLVGDSHQPSFATVNGRGPHPDMFIFYSNLPLFFILGQL